MVKGASTASTITLHVDPAELASILSALDDRPGHGELIRYLETKLAAYLRHRAARRKRT